MPTRSMPFKPMSFKPAPLKPMSFRSMPFAPTSRALRNSRAETRRILLTRGTEWGRDFKGLRVWRVLEMSEVPNLLTCNKLAEMPATLTAEEAAVVVFNHFPAVEVYMWDEPNWIPERTLQDHKAVRVNPVREPLSRFPKAGSNGYIRI